MSFILDALRKAERDRSLGQAPRAEDVALAQEASPQTLRNPRINSRVLIVTALLLAITAGVYRLLSHQPEAPVATAATPAPPPPSGVVTATVRGPAPTAATAVPTQNETTTAGPPALSDDGSLSTLDDLAGNSDDAPLAAEAADAAIEEPVPAEVHRKSDFVAHPSPGIRAGDTMIATEPVPAARQETAAPSTAPPSLASSATALDEMPNDYRAEFPTLSVEVHVWDSSSSKRFAMINGKRYREGDTLAEGPKLSEITQDGLVLDFRNERVLMSLLR